MTEEEISFTRPMVRGGAIHVRNVVQGLRERDYDIHLVDWNDRPEAAHHRSISPRIRQVEGPVRTLHRALEVGREIDADVIVSKTRKTYLPGLLAARRLGIPHVAHVGSTLDAPGNWRRQFDGVSVSFRLRAPHDAYFVVCEYIADQLRDRGVGDDRIYNVRNAVDADQFSPHEMRPLSDRLSRALECSSDEFRIGFVGGIHRYKGVYDLAAAVDRCDVDVHVLVAGDGPERGELESKLDGNATFLGSVPYEEMPAVYGAMDAFVIPSHTEGLPRTILEAQASGTPVIATRVGGVPEAVEEGTTGLLCEPGRPIELADRIEQIVSDRALRETLESCGRTAIVRSFSWNHLYDRYERFLDKIIGR